jgi:hypothetical protein
MMQKDIHLALPGRAFSIGDPIALVLIMSAASFGSTPSRSASSRASLNASV